MRISDWSSDVCSSDLHHVRLLARGHELHARRALLRQLQVDPRRREVDQLAGAVDGQVHRVLLAELLQLLRVRAFDPARDRRSEEHTSELQSLMRISYAVFCLKKKKKKIERLHRIH